MQVSRILMLIFKFLCVVLCCGCCFFFLIEKATYGKSAYGKDELQIQESCCLLGGLRRGLQLSLKLFHFLSPEGGT